MKLAMSTLASVWISLAYGRHSMMETHVYNVAFSPMKTQ